MRRLMLSAAAFQTSVDAKVRAISDGPAIFFNLCGATVTAVESPLDIAAYKFTKLDPKTFEDVRPGDTGPYWDVQGLKSGTRTLVHIWPHGGCSVEIVEADEAEIRRSFDVALNEYASISQGSVERESDKIKDSDGKPMTSSQWRVRTPSGSYLYGLTTYPDARYMTQHMMIVRKVDKLDHK